ncbi:MAG: GH25 family lysozyme, partial [Kofleriaceae bacterium]
MRTHSFAISILILSSCVGDAADEPGDGGDSKTGDGLSVFDKGESGEENNLRARVCAAGTTTFGIDVSYFQGVINWTSVKADGVRFAFIRVSDGIGFRDPKFATNWTGSKSAGVIRGAYQFFRPTQDVIAQADLMISSLGGSYTPGDLPPVIDVEADGGLAPATVAARVRTWVDRVKSRLGVDPIVYTGKYFWRDEVGSPASFAGNPLWIAQYTSLCPDLPPPWATWTFWQNSDSGHVAGISGNVDINKFNGSQAALVAFAGGTTMPPPPPPPTSCNSATLDRDVPMGTCVQAASDGKWYGCNSGVWTLRSSPAGCADAFAWCSSATLGHTVPPRTCVEAASDHIWYQCNGKTWVDPVNTATGTGPAGSCSSMNEL